MTELNLHPEMNRPAGRAGVVAAFTAALALIWALAAPAPLCAQSGTAGTMGNPVPAAPGLDPNGEPAPGCFVTITSPQNWPGQRPNYPCAMQCEGPDAQRMDVAGVCMTAGPGTYSDFSFHPSEPDREFAPGFAPPGSTRCQTATGPEGSPNQGSLWFPRGHPRCAGVSGDPHLRTFDRLRVDFQAAGEFIAVKSLDDELEVQMRLESHSVVATVSFATAVVARVGPHRVMIAAGTGAPLRIDGKPVELAAGYRLLINGGRSWIVRTGRRYTVVWPDGTNLHVDVFGTTVNLFVLAAEPRDGRLVGLLGNADGKSDGNDFRTRDGKALGSPPDFETLYKIFGESWRISAKESLFDYNEGESTETFTRRDLPGRRVTLNDMDPADRTRAEQRCRAAGISDAEPLADCIFDFGFTGEEEFIASALSQQTPPEFMAAVASTKPGAGVATTTTAGSVTIEAPEEGIAAHTIEVHISGSVQPGYWFGFAPAGSANSGQAANPYSARVLQGGTETVKLVVPTIPGDYELRYREARGAHTVAHSQPFRSVAPKLTIEAPATAAPNSSIDVRVSGDVGEFMTFYVVRAGSPDNAQGPGRDLRQGPSGGGSVNLRNTPPGEYEIRCVSNGGTGKQVYAQRKLTVR